MHAPVSLRIWDRAFWSLELRMGSSSLACSHSHQSQRTPRVGGGIGVWAATHVVKHRPVVVDCGGEAPHRAFVSHLPLPLANIVVVGTGEQLAGGLLHRVCLRLEYLMEQNGEKL